MPENIVKQESYNFALQIIELCVWLKQQKHFEISSRLLRSGTGIRANVEEDLAGRSRKDFFAKMSIASKETGQTNYWPRLLRDSRILSKQNSQTLFDESEELIRMSTGILKTGDDNK